MPKTVAGALSVVQTVRPPILPYISFHPYAHYLGKLLVYDIGDMALPRETEWADLQKTLAGLAAPQEDTGLTNGVGGGSLSGGTRGR